MVERVEVTVAGEFAAKGAAATQVAYQATVAAQASEAAIRSLMHDTDNVAEIQNSLRTPTPVRLSQIEAIPIEPGG